MDLHFNEAPSVQQCGMWSWLKTHLRFGVWLQMSQDIGIVLDLSIPLTTVPHSHTLIKWVGAQATKACFEPADQTWLIRVGL